MPFAPLDLTKKRLSADILEGRLSADTLLSRYCGLLYERFGNLRRSRARRTALDRRTAKKYIQQSGMGGD